MDHLCFLCLVFPVLLCLCIAALWSPAGKELGCLLYVLLLFHLVSWFRSGGELDCIVS